MQDRRHGTDGDIRQKTLKQIRVEVIKRGGEGKRRDWSEMSSQAFEMLLSPIFSPMLKIHLNLFGRHCRRKILPEFSLISLASPDPQGCLHQRRHDFIFHQREASQRDSESVWRGNSVPHYQSQRAADGVTVSLHVTWSWSRCGGWVWLKPALF